MIAHAILWLQVAPSQAGAADLLGTGMQPDTMQAWTLTRGGPLGSGQACFCTVCTAVPRVEWHLPPSAHLGQVRPPQPALVWFPDLCPWLWASCHHSEEENAFL